MKTRIQSVSKLILAGSLLLFLSSCNVDLGERGNGNLITDKIEPGDFREIQLGGNFEVILKKSDAPAVIITTDENLMDYIQVENIGSTLEIRSNRKLRPSDNSTITIEYTELDRIEVQGAASLRTENELVSDYLRMSMSGAGDVDMDVDLGRLELDISGVGAVELRGNAEEQSISMSGAGGYDGNELRSRICNVSISGVGGAEVYVTDELNATVSGVGGVSYRGNPSDVRSDISGLGSVSQDKDDENM